MARTKSATSLTSALVPDPTSPPRTQLVMGYLGASAFDGHERLYLEPTLNSYVDIPKGDLLHQVPVPTEHLGAVYIWIRTGADLIYPGQEPASAEEAEASSADPSGMADGSSK